MTGETPIGRRIVFFSVAPFLNLLTPFLILPVLAGATNAAGWAALAVGQSVGAVAAGMVAFGWPVVGPVEIARATARRRREIYTESLLTCLMLLPVVLAVAVALCALGAPDGRFWLTASVAAAGATAGISPSWVAIGLGRAKSIVLFETIPRALILAATAVAIAAGSSIYLYPGALATTSLIALLLFSRFSIRPAHADDWYATTFRRLRSLAGAAASTLTASVYSAGSLLLVGIAGSVQATAEVSSADRLYRIGIVAVMVLTSAFQSWVVHSSPGEALRRRTIALRTHISFGIVGAAAFAGLAPQVARVLFGADVAPSYTVTAFYGLTFGLLATASSIAQHYMVPTGQLRGILASTIAGAVVGAPAILLLTIRFGAEGGAAGLALSEATVLVIQAKWTRRRGVVNVDGLGCRS